VGDIRAVTETTDEQNAPFLNNLTYIHDFTVNRHMQLASSTWRNWMTAGGTGPTTLGVVFIRLKSASPLFRPLKSTSGFNINLANTTGSAAFGNLTATSGGNTSLQTANGVLTDVAKNVFATTYTLKNSSDREIWANKAASATLARTDTMPVIDNTDSIDFPQNLDNDFWGMLAIWAAPVEWDQTKQDAFCDALKLGERIVPVEATSGWWLDPGSTVIPASIPDRIGSGPALSPVGSDAANLQISTENSPLFNY
jgi:hypothetical protein